jgi:hypothetical protein
MGTLVVPLVIDDHASLYQFKADVLWVVLAGGLIGLAWKLLGG